MKRDKELNEKVCPGVVADPRLETQKASLTLGKPLWFWLEPTPKDTAPLRWFWATPNIESWGVWWDWKSE